MDRSGSNTCLMADINEGLICRRKKNDFINSFIAEFLKSWVNVQIFLNPEL